MTNTFELSTTWYVSHGAESKRLLHLVLVTNLIPRGSEIRSNHSLDVIGHHHLQILQLFGRRTEGREVYNNKRNVSSKETLKTSRTLFIALEQNKTQYKRGWITLVLYITHTYKTTAHASLHTWNSEICMPSYVCRKYRKTTGKRQLATEMFLLRE